MTKLSHVDSNDRPVMVDVSGKEVTARQARARSVVEFPAVVAARFADGDIKTAKGPVFATAIVAGTMAAKKTHDLIPFCHPLGLDNCSITIEMDADNRAVVDCVCKVYHRTGVEMEALVGASIAALTIYDMCKALSHEITIRDTRLVSKTGGKEDYRRAGE
ncbi:MAG: cyclic pyranopterin monophosphate synthase MoaC [Woeseia sp.]